MMPSNETATLTRLYEEMRNLADQGNFEMLDRVFSLVRPDDLSELALTALLRYSFAYRSRLPSWIGFRDEVTRELLNRGDDPDEILRGLY